jgi:hypothetical protein
VAGHQEHRAAAREPRELGEGAWPLYRWANIVGIVGIVLALVVGYFVDRSFRRFFFTYLVSFMFFLSIALGGLIFVMLQHLTRAGWSVSIRRVSESLAATLPLVGALSVPIVISVLLNDGSLFRWAQPVPAATVAHHEDVHVPDAGREAQVPRDISAAQQHDPAHSPAQHTAVGSAAEDAHLHRFEHPSAHGVSAPDELTLSKRAMLNPAFFTVRIIVYFVVWSALALWFWRQSTLQDVTGDAAHTTRMQTVSAPGLLLLAITTSFAAFDLLMSLDPHWFSTMMGIYFITGCFVAIFASMILILVTLQKLGYLVASVSVEHYHDLGKWLFGFVFFWGYIAFSQYMLIWYASIPEEVGWFARRGASTHPEHTSPWSWVSIVLLGGHLLIPFAGLISRHVKRRRKLLAFWAGWVLVFHWLDLFWVIVPELDGHVYFGILDIVTFLGIGGIFLATFVRILAGHALKPVNDPRLHESLAFQNI